ncbi:MAG: flavin reductase family protein [Candidatus Omnitrophica bacterium]|nr:flavin reductase family protein [Candidatus Omnitrophota bacterium]MDD5311240.1 flavin reductase family protein [Candidatus Omnitrophota bacterium]MDD5545727.1 flavin reductase family protein [Candidatus Omnitrophota bacterium]
MAKKEIKGDVALFPLPVVLVTCVGKNGKPNIITLAWAGVVCSEPPMVSISIRPHRHSHPLIKETGEFTVNIPTSDIMKETDICGMVSGRDTDKFALTKLTPEPATHVKSPLIKECPVNLECKVKSAMLLGTHEVFLAEVVAVHIDESVMTETGRIDYAKAKPFSYNWGEYWSVKEKIGHYGCSKK